MRAIGFNHDKICKAYMVGEATGKNTQVARAGTVFYRVWMVCEEYNPGPGPVGDHY